MLGVSVKDMDKSDIIMGRGHICRVESGYCCRWCSSGAFDNPETSGRLPGKHGKSEIAICARQWSLVGDAGTFRSWSKENCLKNENDKKGVNGFFLLSAPCKAALKEGCWTINIVYDITVNIIFG